MTKLEIIDADIDRQLAGYCTSKWLAVALTNALNRDPVDAANDAELLASLLRRRAAAIIDANS